MKAERRHAHTKQSICHHCFFLRVIWLSLAICALILTGCASFLSGVNAPMNASPRNAITQKEQASNAAFNGQKGVTWQIEPMWGEWPNTNWAAVAQDAADISNAHITWARVSLLQDHPFAYFDKVVQLAKAYHIQLVAIVYKSDPPNDLGTQAQRNAYKSWLAQAVQRYKSYVHYWEIQNEENSPVGWNIDTDPQSDQAQYDASVERFVLDMQDSYETIHASDPTAHVLYGGLSQYRAERYLDSMIKFDAYRYMDIMAFHPYASDPAGVLDRLKMLQGKMATQPGFASKPIWVTEVGFHTQANWTGTPGYVPTEQEKASYLVQTMELLRASGVQLSFWYTLHEPEDIDGYGLTRRDPTTFKTVYLPAYAAYKAL
jgi:hypothetical protein